MKTRIGWEEVSLGEIVSELRPEDDEFTPLQRRKHRERERGTCPLEAPARAKALGDKELRKREAGRWLMRTWSSSYKYDPRTSALACSRFIQYRRILNRSHFSTLKYLRK